MSYFGRLFICEGGFVCGGDWTSLIGVYPYETFKNRIIRDAFPILRRLKMRGHPNETFRQGDDTLKIGYIRVSTQEQNTIRQEVLMHELGVDEVYIDRMSGKNTDRPEL